MMRHFMTGGMIALALVSSAGLAQPCEEPRTTGWIQDVVESDPTPLMGYGSFLIGGRSYVVAGDVDADGFDDVVIGAPECQVADCFDSAGAGVPGERRPVAQVFSGRTGALIGEFVSPSPPAIGGGFGALLAAADINGDWHADVAVAATFERVDLDDDGAPEPSVGAVHVFSGASGELSYSIVGSSKNERLGWTLNFVGDWTGDGAPDLLIGSKGAGNANVLRLYSGADGELVSSHTFAPGFFWVRIIGDVSGDGQNDAAVIESNGGSQVYLMTSAALAPTLLIDTPDEFSPWGDPVGDVSGDGVADLVLHSSRFFGSLNDSEVTAISGADGSVVRQFPVGEIAYPSLARVIGVGDVDNDGAPDIAIGPIGEVSDEGSVSERMNVYSMADGACLGAWRTRDETYDYNTYEGLLADPFRSMAPGDFDGDGRLDVAAVGVPINREMTPYYLRQINIFRRPGCPEDMTGDGFVGFADLSAFLDTFNDIDHPGALPADIDGNGQVDFSDLNLILAAFNSVC